MSAVDLLAELRALGVRVVAQGWQLRFFAPAGVLSAELRARVAAERSMLIEALRREQGIALPGELPALRSDWPADWIEAFEERAAIMEFDGGLARSEAERDAEVSVRRAYRDSVASAASALPKPSNATAAALMQPEARRPSGEPVRTGSLFGEDAVRTSEEPADRTGGRRTSRAPWERSGGAA